MPGVFLVPVPRQPRQPQNKTRNQLGWGLNATTLKCLAASNGSQNIFLGDSLVSSFMEFGNQELKKLASSFPSGLINYGTGGDHIEHVLWRYVNVYQDSLRRNVTVTKFIFSPNVIFLATIRLAYLSQYFLYEPV